MRAAGCLAFLLISNFIYGWGFYGHRKINYQAVFLLPPEMMVLYKLHAGFLGEHAIDPDKRRYLVADEGPRHYLDLDKYGSYPFDSLPRKWEEAVAKYTIDSLRKHGIVPWWIQVMHRRLVHAFREKDQVGILKLSAEIGHYIADAHVPLHASSNHNGQFTGQKGIHGFWESRIPELLAEEEWDFFVGKADYLNDPPGFTWKRVLESALAADTVLKFEKQLTASFPADRKFSFEERNGVIIRQYSSEFCRAYDNSMKGMVERRMRQSIYAVACFWYTAWVDAGQPDLGKLVNKDFTEAEIKEFETLNMAWRNREMIGRKEEE